MSHRRLRATRVAAPILESLEGRVVLSTMSTAAALAHGTAHVATKSAHPARTQTTLATNGGTLGSPITFTVTVHTSAAAGAPTGSVRLIEQGQTIQNLTLTPVHSTSSRAAASQVTYTLNQQQGGAYAYFGKYPVTAMFVPSGSFARSQVSKNFVVHPPQFTTLSTGVKIATVTPGTGPAIQTGQTASVLYTGYLASNGQIFDDSANNGGTPFQFKLGSGQVIPGFDAGTAGMQVGETRIVEIPPAQGYGSSTSGAIPANSTLIFVLTLKAIS